LILSENWKRQYRKQDTAPQQFQFHMPSKFAERSVDGKYTPRGRPLVESILNWGLWRMR